MNLKNGLEVDLIIQRSEEKDILLEIKSAREIREEHAKTTHQIASDWNSPCEVQVWSQDPQAQKIKRAKCLPWHVALRKLFGVKGL